MVLCVSSPPLFDGLFKKKEKRKNSLHQLVSFWRHPFFVSFDHDVTVPEPVISLGMFVYLT